MRQAGLSSMKNANVWGCVMQEDKAQLTLIDQFKRDHTVHDLLPKYGYMKISDDEYISPNSQSGHSARVFKDGEIIVSLSDSDAGVGKDTGASHTANAFDLFLHYECNGDLLTAIQRLKELYPRKTTHQNGVPYEPANNEQAFCWRSVADLAGKPIPERNWLVYDWIPGKQVTLLYGDGGTGKSLIAMQLCLAVASDRPWLQLPTEKGRSLYLSAEDDEDELHRRFANIARGMSLDLHDFSNCHYLSLAGEDALFAVQDKSNQTMQHSPLFDAFCEAIKKYQPQVAVVDTLADVYPADENQRNAARQFIQLLRKPAIENNCSVIVLAHPSLAGLNSGSGTSGSTAWSNSVRSRLYLTRPGGADTDPDLRILELMKSNYSRIGTTINLRWKHGVFIHQNGGAQLDRAALNEKAERVFLHLLDAYTEQGRPVNASSGTNYAPTIFASDPKAEGITKAKFSAVMKSLFHKNIIANEQRKGSRGSFIVRKNHDISFTSPFQTR